MRVRAEVGAGAGAMAGWLAVAVAGAAVLGVSGVVW